MPRLEDDLKDVKRESQETKRRFEKGARLHKGRGTQEFEQNPHPNQGHSDVCKAIAKV